ncbi:MAG: PAS domain S-box protein [Sulfurimicrobium sp.]|nr:PAS domain S-box protein [Sulfurimicrobium sp.]MDP1704877.1 PAS domain S-box protein [Sulfurimicrobium sp.]MDP2198747.1 PAS domain S-box protein [Sulfurimicrobium sp.]MDP3686127.1 PAS domain S-box protein [Sulfurimicrobium sp.]
MNSPRILIVEDDPLMAQELQLRLEMLNYGVAGIVASGEESQLQVAVLKPDLILMDVVLYGAMDGIEAARQIHLKHDVPVVFLTAYSDKDLLKRAKSIGPLAYLVKPLKEKELQLTIELALSQHRMETHSRQARIELERRVAERTAELEIANQRLQQEMAQREETAKALLERETSYRILFEEAPVGIVTANAGKRFTSANPAFCRMLGYTEDELLEKTFLEITCPDDRSENDLLTEQALRGEIHSYRLNKRYVKKNGEILWVTLSSSLIRDNAGHFVGFLAVVEDVTALKQAEALRLEQEAAQRRALVREVHHRIKNNLQGMTGLLRQQMESHPEVRSILEEVISQVNSITLVYGLQSKGASQQLVLTEVLEAIGRAAGEIVGGGNAPQFEFRLDVPLLVRVDEGVPLALVLNELILNAFKHRSTDPTCPVRIVLSGGVEGAVVEIFNPGLLGKDFRFDTGHCLGTGLDLVKALLPARGARLEIFAENGLVHARLTLSTPVVSSLDGERNVNASGSS